MKLLHTSDWHVGKAMRGQSRADEHEAVLTEMRTHAKHDMQIEAWVQRLDRERDAAKADGFDVDALTDSARAKEKP